MSVTITRTNSLALMFAISSLSGSFATAHAQSGPPVKVLEPDEPEDVRQYMSFGSSVGVVGGLAMVGGPTTDGHGAVYVFRQQPGSWVQRDRIVAPDIAPGTFGSNLAFDGSTALISDFVRGRVYYYEYDSSNRWRARAILTGGTGNFGSAIAMSGCTALIASSARWLGDYMPQKGFVHVLNRCTPDNRWAWTASISPPGSTVDDAFGVSIALSPSGTEILVGAPGADSNKGAVYNYALSNGSWVLKQRFVEANPQPNDRAFGSSVAFHDSLAVVGSPGIRGDIGTGIAGVVFTFKRVGESWTATGEMRPPQDLHFDQYGLKIVVTADRVLVGAPGPGQPGFGLPGYVFVYRRTGDTLVLESTFGGADAARFGTDFAVAGRTLVVGEPYMKTRIDSQDGTAYIHQLLP